MNKYYTAVFSPTDFCVLMLYFAIMQFLQSVFSLGFDGAAQRVYFDYQERKPFHEFLGTLSLIIVGAILFGSVIALFLENKVIAIIGGSSQLYRLTVLGAIFLSGLKIWNSFAINDQKSSLVLRQNVVQTIANHGGSLALISIFGWGMIGRQIGICLAYGLNLIAYLYDFVKEKKIALRDLSFELPVLKKLLHYAIPSFSTVLITTGLSYVDRFLLQYYHGPEKVGLYALGYIVGQALSMVIEALSSALFPSVMKTLQDDYAAGIRTVKKFDKIFCGGLILSGLLIFFLRDFIVLLLSNKSYASAGDVVPFIVWAYVFGGMYKVASQILTYHGIVWFYPALSVISYGLSSGLSLILVPQYNMIGAAYAFFIGPFVYSFGVHYMCRSYYVPLRLLIAFYGGVGLAVSLYFYYRIVSII